MFVIWEDFRVAPYQSPYFQHLTGDGQVFPGWPVDGRAATSGDLYILGYLGAVPDGRGGFFLPLAETNPAGTTPISACLQHIQKDGSITAGFTNLGVLISNAFGDNIITGSCSDDSLGVYLAWSNDRSLEIRAVRMRSDGSVAPGWPSNGALLTGVGGLGTTDPPAVADGFGGVFVAWAESLRTGGYIPYVTRLRRDGSPSAGWSVTGNSARGLGLPVTTICLAASPDGGVYAAWSDQRAHPPGDQNNLYGDVYLQRFTPMGAIAQGWPTNGLPVCLASGRQYPVQALPDGAGGVYVVWQDERDNGPPNYLGSDVYAARVRSDATLAPGWAVSGNPVVVGPGYQQSIAAATDGNHGFYAGVQSVFSDYHCFVQHMLPDGTIDPTYSSVGNPVVSPQYSSGSQQDMSILEDGGGGFFTAWVDGRPDNTNGNIWATRINPDAATAVALSLISSDAHPDGVSLLWQAPRTLRATVERREGGGAWQSLAEVVTDGEYRLRYDDHAVTGGKSYDYRLAYADLGGMAYSVETTVLVPAGYALALSGFRPNPVASAALAVAFELPSAAPGKLEVIDIGGRRVVERDLSGYTAGRYVERLGSGAHLAAGMYWLRLTHGAEMRTARGVVLE